METKRCNRCGETKPVEDFYLLRKDKPWRGAYCKPCDKINSRENARKNPGRNREYVKNWREMDPFHARLIDMEKSARFRWRKAGLAVEKFTYSAVLERDGWSCYICRGVVEEEDLSFDHVITLSRGGPHAFDNVKVSHFRCNSGKGASTAEEYYPKFLPKRE